MWIPAAVLGLLAVATGLLPLPEALSVTERVAPVLAFLVGITVIAELADTAEVFDVAAVRAARLGRGKARRLFLLVVVLGTLTTTVLSLDTTAVLLTPVVLALAQRLGLRPLPFAMTAVWLANTASLLLPVANLTNLLAVGRLHLSTAAFAARMALTALAAVVASAGVLATWYRRDLRQRYDTPPPLAPADRALFATAAAVCLLVGPLFAVGLPVEYVALAGAVVLSAVFAVRRRDALRLGLLPWRLVLLVEGLFLVVSAAGRHGLDALLRAGIGGGDSALGVLRTAGLGAAASNLVNNLPAYLALERAIPTGHRTQLLALLVGTNVGPLVLLWGSLATLLWRERCRSRGVTVTAGEFARLGLVGVPLVLAATVAALLLA
ncbi:MAG: SLC13 family permease [Actinomycetota bacterium]|nr:SLC13 family permease [Actinomycetota bacterium]